MKGLGLVEVFTRLVLALAILMKPEFIQFAAIIFSAGLLSWHVWSARQLSYSSRI